MRSDAPALCYSTDGELFVDDIEDAIERAFDTWLGDNPHCRIPIVTIEAGPAQPIVPAAIAPDLRDAITEAVWDLVGEECADLFAGNLPDDLQEQFVEWIAAQPWVKHLPYSVGQAHSITYRVTGDPWRGEFETVIEESGT